jgi:RHS repeat-associated protein
MQGESVSHPYGQGGTVTHKINYAQNYKFDKIDNMTLKASTETTTPKKTAGASLNYTPYGEQWVEQVSNGAEILPFRFTGQTLDDETGLYYYGARYLDPRTSRWLSTAPGMGGVFNVWNLQAYHYAGNNPIRYIDPDGKSNESTLKNIPSLYAQELKVQGNVVSSKHLSGAGDAWAKFSTNSNSSIPK